MTMDILATKIEFNDKYFWCKIVFLFVLYFCESLIFFSIPLFVFLFFWNYSSCLIIFLNVYYLSLYICIKLLFSVLI